MLRRLLAASIVSLALFAAAEACADERIGTCVDAAERGQDLRDRARLLEARALFLACAQQQCPGAVRDSCAEWLQEVNARVPTFVVAAKDDRGRDVAVVASLDGGRLPGFASSAVSADPGAHTLEVEAPGYARVREQIVLREGEPHRVITITLRRTLVADAASRLPDGMTNGCSGAWHKQVIDSKRASIVRVETVGFSIHSPMGGLVFPNRSYVVAASEALGVGRGAHVVFANGTRLRARAVAVDEANHLALLALDGDAPAQAVELAGRAPRPGEEVAALDEGRIRTGHVVTDDGRTTVVLHRTSRVGRVSPVFGCDGMLVAVGDEGRFVSEADVRSLSPSPVAPSDKRWLPHFHGGGGMQFDTTRAYLGSSLGGSLVYADRLQLALRLGVLGGLPAPGDAGEEVLRVQAETTVGYRFFLTRLAPLYLRPEVGVVGRADFVVTKRPNAVSRTSDARVAPVLGMTFIAAMVGLGYRWQLDLENVTRSTHHVFFDVEL